MIEYAPFFVVADYKANMTSYAEQVLEEASIVGASPANMQYAAPPIQYMSATNIISPASVSDPLNTLNTLKPLKPLEAVVHHEVVAGESCAEACLEHYGSSGGGSGTTTLLCVAVILLILFLMAREKRSDLMQRPIREMQEIPTRVYRYMTAHETRPDL